MTNRTAAQANYAASQLIHRDNYATVSAAICKHLNGFDSRLITRHAVSMMGSHDVQSVNTLARILKAATFSATKGTRIMDTKTAAAIAADLI